MWVVIAPEDEAHDAVLDALAAWSRVSLLDDVTWWALAEGESTDPPRQVTLLRRGETHTVTPDVALSTGDGTVDIAVLTLGSDDVHRAFRPRSAMAVEALLELSSGMRSDVVVLRVPTDRRAAVVSDDDWLTVAISPCHRGLPGPGIDHLADHDDLVGIHAAHALAVVTGLLPPGAGVAGFVPTIRADVGRIVDGGDPAPTVVTAFTRAVDITPLHRTLLDAITVWDPADPPAGVEPYVAPAAQLDDLARSFIDRHPEVFGATPAPEPLAGPAVVEGVLPYLLLCLSEALRLVARYPARLAHRLARGFYERTARRAERYGLPLTGRVLAPFDDPNPEPSEHDEVERLDLDRGDGPVGLAWRDLTRLVTGLHDGDGHPSWVDTAFRARLVSSAQLVPQDDGTTSLLGAVRSLLAARRDELDADVEEARRLEREEEAQHERDRRQHERSLRKVLSITAWIIIGTAIGVTLMIVGLTVLGGTPGVALALASPLVGTAIVAYGLVRTGRPILRARRRRAEHRAAVADLRRAATVGGHDRERLERRIHDLDDWVTVLTWVLAAPSELGARATVPDALDPSVHPPAFAVAVPDVEAGRLEALTQACRMYATMKPWRLGLLERLIDHEMESLQRSEGIADPVAGPPYDPFEDISLRPSSPRRKLRAACEQPGADGLRSDYLRERYEQAVTTVLAQDVQVDLPVVTGATVWTPLAPDHRSTLGPFLAAIDSDGFELPLEHGGGVQRFERVSSLPQVIAGLDHGPPPARIVTTALYRSRSR